MKFRNEIVYNSKVFNYDIINETPIKIEFLKIIIFNVLYRWEKILYNNHSLIAQDNAALQFHQLEYCFDSSSTSCN